MEYELKHYYRVKYALVCARQSFLKEPPKDDYEEYARKVIGRAYFIILNKIDELDGTNERLLEYLSVKNTVLSKILLDSMSIYSRTKRLKKDKNKMSICGIPFYVAAVFVLLINLVFLFITDIPIEPWGIETSKFIVYANTLNDKISSISILLLLMSIVGYIAFTIIHSTKETKPKWIKVFAWMVAAIMFLTAVLSSIYFLIELIASFS